MPQYLLGMIEIMNSPGHGFFFNADHPQSNASQKPLYLENICSDRSG
jgi:hypothetical protein